MDTSNLDLVYFVKDSAYNDELKYSLRSAEQNLPHRHLVIVGGKPSNIAPDLSIPVKQKGATKWEKVRNMMSLVVQDPRISEDFVLMNDDFFVLSPVQTLPAYYHESLPHLIADIELKNNYRSTVYTKQVLMAYEALSSRHLSSFNAELHIPMVLNKKRLLRLREVFPDTIPCTRSLYANYYKDIPLAKHKDVKCASPLDVPDTHADFLSSSDESFQGLVGKFIRCKFPNKSRWER